MVRERVVRVLGDRGEGLHDAHVMCEHKSWNAEMACVRAAHMPVRSKGRRNCDGDRRRAICNSRVCVACAGQ